MERFNVGPNYGGTGSDSPTQRIGTSGATIVADAHAHFWEANRVGMQGTGQGLWCATVPATGVAPGTALSTAGNPLVLWNPPNSGVVAVIAAARMVFLSGTLGAGTIFYTAGESQVITPSAGTAISPVSNLIGDATAPRVKAYSGATLQNTPQLLAPIMQVTATAPASWSTFKDLLDGEFCVLPGGVFSIQEIGAAGTSPLFIFSFTWEEVPALI